MWRPTWPRPGRRQPRAEGAAGRDLCAECEAFLAGRVDDHLAAANRPFPAWVWLNRLAHGSLDDVRALAESNPISRLDALTVVADIARHVLRKVEAREDNLRALQHQMLVPLESAMAAWSPRTVPIDNHGLARAIDRALATSPKPLPDPRPHHKP